MPQKPPVQVRVWHSVSFPGQSLGIEQGSIVVVPVPLLIVAPVLPVPLVLVLPAPPVPVLAVPELPELVSVP
jgi:hypothetical protein